MELPPLSSPRSELVAALADLAREITGSYSPEHAAEVRRWIDVVEARLTGAPTPEDVTTPRRERKDVSRCSKCGRGGHNRTTCPEPDPLERALAATVTIEPPR